MNPIDLSAVQSPTDAAERRTPSPENDLNRPDYFHLLPVELRREIYALVLLNDGKWIQKSSKHPVDHDYATKYEPHDAAFWRCNNPAPAKCDHTCPIHGHGLQVAKLDHRYNKEVNAFIAEHATWWVINWLGVHPMTRFRFKDGKWENKSDGMTVSVMFVDMTHMIDCYPYKLRPGEIVPDEQFDIDLFGDCQRDGALGWNSMLLKARNNVFRFLREIMLPLQQDVLESKVKQIPKMSFLLEFPRDSALGHSWARDNISAVVKILIDPFKMLKLGQLPTWEVWPVRPDDINPDSGEVYEPEDYDAGDDIHTCPATYTSGPRPVTMVESYHAWLRWHWRIYHPQHRYDLYPMFTCPNPGPCYEMIDIGCPEMDIEHWIIPDNFYPWAYCRAQWVADQVAQEMRQQPSGAMSLSALDRTFVDSVIQIVHSAEHVDEYKRIWLLTKALLLNEPGGSQHKKAFRKWMDELRQWDQQPCSVEARGKLPSISQGLGQHRFHRTIGDGDDGFPDWYNELFAGDPVRASDSNSGIQGAPMGADYRIDGNGNERAPWWRSSPRSVYAKFEAGRGAYAGGPHEEFANNCACKGCRRIADKVRADMAYARRQR